ncbi:hypothetical protein SAMN04488100_11460 [Alkalibacterium putridalgicola]|uniref:Heat induced stress protein YflT n=1 Tax=Alkalibacterium putridalgicola TaxID=426703 RepID=A0A1H7TXW9_9LACT|nr:hypothetical protein [Alkalibacterium putridalgicola]GEK88574.1 hypothetical protein APU01nite_06130 [Alkalibacterium putridalgicola]SEL89308.1 hypothetical protein SAMN04488100_11460 [Alkalibacterium putridalgicola]
MNTHVEGSYAKVEDALRAVDTLIMRGYDADAIILISSKAHQEEQLKAVDITVKQISDLTDQDKKELGKHMEDLEDGRFVVQVTEDKGESKEQSPDVNPLQADRAYTGDDSGLTSEEGSYTADAELLEDLRNSSTDPSNNRSNDAIGYSDSMKNPNETPLDNGPNRSL